MIFNLDIFVNPVSPFICFVLAILFGRKNGVSIRTAIYFPIRRSALNFQPKTNEIFDKKGILLIIAGYILAVIYVFN
jgi:hypothetical protein